MKRIPLYTILLFGLIITLFTSCIKKEPPPDPVIANHKYVNEWIKQNMELYYLWNEKMPSKLNNTIDPESYFYASLYKYDKDFAPDGDRHSWIEKDYLELQEYLSGVVRNELGFDYKFYRYNENDVFGEFAYIKKDTDAAAKGLKRGQAFTHVNNTKMTLENYSTLLSNARESASVTLRVQDPSFDPDSRTIHFDNEQTITINLHSKYAENPIYLDSVYTINGKTIGYLVYHFFAADARDGTNAYNLALNNVFQKFKSRSVDNIILDLRYNNGGSVRSAIYLSSMIVKNLNTKNVFSREEYNREYQDFLVKQHGEEWLIEYFVDRIGNIPLYNIGTVQTLYVLTGNYTASASELVINALIPYMDVFLIGTKTYGKNVGSTTFYKENDPKNKWGLQPIIAKFYNSVGKSDFTDGFPPDINDPDTWNMPKRELGDVNEALLELAIGHITSEVTPHTIATRSARPTPDFALEVGSSLSSKPWRNQIIMDNR